MKWKNFYIWNKRLPHWRADSVMYYITFKHRISLDEPALSKIFSNILKTNGRKWDILALSTSADATHMLATFQSHQASKAKEIAKIIEPLKLKIQQDIIKHSCNTHTLLFYQESYDHIIRNEEDLDSHLNIIKSIHNPDLLWINQPSLENFDFLMNE